MTVLSDLSKHLASCEYKGYRFSCLPMHSEQEVLRVEVCDLEEIPIFVTVTETQILCISYLFTKQEIHPEMEADLNQYLLELNVPMPLSAFALVDNYYTIFGALAVESSNERICQELITLAGNAIDTIQALEDYIK